MDDYLDNITNAITDESHRTMYKPIINGVEIPIFIWHKPDIFEKNNIVTAELEDNLDLANNLPNYFINVTDDINFRGKYIHLNLDKFLLIYNRKILSLL